MLRLLFLLLLGGAVWWLSGGRVGEAKHTDQPEVAFQAAATSADAAVASPPATEEGSAAAAPTAARPSRTPLRVGAAEVAPDPEVARLIEALAAQRWDDAQGAWEALRLATGEPRARLAEALAQAAKGADLAGNLALLGADNAFVHSELGRQVGQRIAAAAKRQPPEQAVVTLTRLIEGAMRGPIEKGDAAAKEFVDGVYSALQRPLRRTVLNPAFLDGAETHEVLPGEALSRIARSLRKRGVQVDAGTLMAFNRISDPRRLRAGQRLKVPLVPIRSVLEKRSYLLAVYAGDVIFRLYWVGHGRDDCTPETTFVVLSKQERPDWYADGRVIPYGHPENVLGDYFVKFEHASYTGFGAHGTAEPKSVGTMASAGCLRMLDADIADYFRIVPHGSQVEIRASGSGY
ncbi:MAG: L,D-transpeptidase family protein [Planctomycetota bacterium]